MKFNDLYWHDSIIKNIIIDRSNPGEIDTVLFEIDWFDKGLGQLVFEDVYYVTMEMNFGVIAPECIDSAFVADENDDTLKRCYQKWGGLIDDILLFCFVIKTISTDSEIKIIAKRFRVEKKLLQ